MRTLVIGEYESGAITDATLRVVTAAAQRGLPVDVLVTRAEAANPAAQIAGVQHVLLATVDFAENADTPGAITPETLATQLAALANEYSLIAASHRATGRAALPRAAALADGAFLADVTAVLDPQRFVRSLYAGSVVATVETTSAVTFATFRASSFAPAADTGGAASITALAPIAPFAATRLLERQAAPQTGRDLASARIVVSGGRGLGSQENMTRLASFAGRLGAALGASRAAVDAGYAPNAAQVGQTGKTVAPEVYLAFGISGAIQHLAGMKDSQIIVAVNKDPDAPIFSVADYGIVGDLFEVLAQLEGQLEAHRLAVRPAS